MACINQGVYAVFQENQANEVSNVQLHPELLSKHQVYVKEKTNSKSDKPVLFVFHGGSGSSKGEYAEAIKYGVVKVNMDTGERIQWNMQRPC